LGFVVRAAVPEDYDGIAEVHMDSIRTLGPAKYDADAVNDWASVRTGEEYARRANDGAKLFVAVDGGSILGFSDYRAAQGRHRTAIYVRASAARSGVGTALFERAEAAAREGGATEIHVDASLVAVPFYLANGFEEIGRGEHTLRTGRTIPCIIMRKRLA
jgi:putative acetyltransferase